MHFPLLPLIGVLSALQGLNVALSAVVVAVALIVAIVFLVGNAHKPGHYEKDCAQIGFLALGITIFVAIVGITYIVTVFAAAVVLYLLGYWVLWRYLIKNIIAALEREKPKEKSTTEPIKKPDNIRDHD